jgi:hypothetical protein
MLVQPPFFLFPPFPTPSGFAGRKTEASREAENFSLSRDGWEASELSATMFNQPFNPGFPGRIGSIQNEVFL